MFPDSACTNIRCGLTKATYHAVWEICPFVRTKMGDWLNEKLFGVHLDETVNNNKSRLEFWITHMNDSKERQRF